MAGGPPGEACARAAAVLVAAMVLGPVAAASAHPLGNFTINHYSGIHVSPDEIRVDYVIDMAEIPAFQEMEAIDTDGDDQGSDAELAAWADAKAAGLAEGLTLSVDGRDVPLEVRSARAQLLPGQGGLQTLRFEGDFTAPAPAEGTAHLHRRELRRPDRVARDHGGGRGRRGPRGLLRADRQRQRCAAVLPAGSAGEPAGRHDDDGVVPPGVSVPGSSPSLDATGGPRPGPAWNPARSTALLANQGIGLVLLGVVLAVAFGAWHALLPGHGKTLMAAYMVGSKARKRQAVAVGTAVAVMHTASVLALGLRSWRSERTFRPEIAVSVAGAGLGSGGAGTGRLSADLAAVGVGEQGPRPRRPRPCTTTTTTTTRRRTTTVSAGIPHALPEGAPLSPRGLMALALAGGILPAPSALIVMLGAINAHRVGYGLALVLAFSVGLATALIVIGMGALRARDADAARLSSSGAAGAGAVGGGDRRRWACSSPSAASADLSSRRPLPSVEACQSTAGGVGSEPAGSTDDRSS